MFRTHVPAGPLSRQAWFPLLVFSLFTPLGCGDENPSIPGTPPEGAILVVVGFPQGGVESWSLQDRRTWSQSPLEATVGYFQATNLHERVVSIPYEPDAEIFLALWPNFPLAKGTLWDVQVTLHRPGQPVEELAPSYHSEASGAYEFTCHGTAPPQIPSLEGVEVTVAADEVAPPTCEGSMIELWAISKPEPFRFAGLSGQRSWQIRGKIPWQSTEYSLELPSVGNVLVRYPTVTRPGGVHVLVENETWELECESYETYCGLETWQEVSLCSGF